MGGSGGNPLFLVFEITEGFIVANRCKLIPKHDSLLLLRITTIHLLENLNFKMIYIKSIFEKLFLRFIA